MFIQSRIARDYSLGTTDSEETWLLPTNPISFLGIGIDALTAAANVADDALTLASQLLSIDVLFRGTQIVSVSGDDLIRLVDAMGIFTPKLYNPETGDNSERQLSLVLPFGRRLFSAGEAFPASRGGELELRIQWDAANATYDTLNLNVSAFELPDAQPGNFLRYTTMSDTPSATGVKDYDLPRLSPLLGVGIFQTNVIPPSAAPTIDTFKVLRNNQDFGYTDIDAKTLRGLYPFNSAKQLSVDNWTQLENTDGAYTQNAESSGRHTNTGPSHQFVYLDYDPLKDGAHILDGTQASDLKLRVDFDSADAIRIFPVEWMRPQQLPGRASR